MIYFPDAIWDQAHRTHLEPIATFVRLLRSNQSSIGCVRLNGDRVI